MDVSLRLYRADGLHGEIRVGDACAELDETQTFLVSDLVDRIMRGMGYYPTRAVWEDHIPLNGKIVNLKDAERAIIMHAVGFDKPFGKIAKQLGITDRTLYEKRRQYGLPVHPRVTEADFDMEYVSKEEAGL